MDKKRLDKTCAMLRMEAVLNSRSKLVEEVNSLLTDECEDKLVSEEAKRAYENLEEVYADIIIAESKYLQNLKDKDEKHKEIKELLEGSEKAAKKAFEDFKKNPELFFKNQISK